MDAAAMPVELVAGFANGARVTRLSSPLIHFTSRAAKMWKRLRRPARYAESEGGT
jgi:hypothetical protein